MNSAHSASARISLAPLYWLALGTFAVGTESFMIAGLLPDMAADLHTSIVATGQLVTVFALANTLSSPVMAALTGGLHRRTLAHWSFYPARQAGLISIAGLRGTPIALSLNASFMYLSFSPVAALGSLTLSLSSVSDLGWTAAACKIAALVLTVVIRRLAVQEPKLACAAV